MTAGRYLKDKLYLYLLLALAIGLFALVIVLLPYETVYVQDRTYLQVFLAVIIVCVAVFVLGTVYNVLVWMHGKGLAGSPEGRFLRLVPKALKFLFSGRFWKAVSVLGKDAFYLSKLKERSVTRWAMHLSILGGFALMFVLDLVVTFCLDILHYQPMIQEDGWAKLWIRDFAFEVAGLMMLVGLLIAATRRFLLKPKMVRTELPDAASILFLIAVVLGGFILEGMGIAGEIPDHQLNNAYSFVGYTFSLVMPSSSGDYYDQAWLIHGVLSALLIAYIPFSKLFHMLATPIAIEAERLAPEGVVA